ncbi:DUF305 domain-containing protein [Cellulomonas sp. 179-A 9B4 NHS]|uniref:DUF305 domain-containing protein n=1 Tax=Cellulomonas sp. 179-A 9B4 NHS TaxID=3142379 RepID=UPI0039A17729
MNTTQRRAATVACALSLALAVAGCSDGTEAQGQTAESSTTSQASTPTPTASTAMSDAMFAAMMIPHHQTGIEMTQMALQKAATPGVREVAQAAQTSQQEQLPLLEEVAATGDMKPMPPEEPIQRFNEQEMAELMALEGEAFDRKWLDVFSSHHMSAIMMADVALASDGSPAAQQLEQEIHDGQLGQLEQMNTLRDQLG